MQSTTLQARARSPRVVRYADILVMCVPRTSAPPRQWRWAAEVLERLREGGLEANLIVCNSAASACEKGGRWRPALRLLSAAQASALEPDVISCSTAVAAPELAVKGGLFASRASVGGRVSTS